MVCAVWGKQVCSEALSKQLKPLGIGVTVVCPGFVRTRIMESQRNRPHRYGSIQTLDPASPLAALAAQRAERVQSGIEPEAVATMVLDAIRKDEHCVFTHTGIQGPTGGAN